MRTLYISIWIIVSLTILAGCGGSEPTAAPTTVPRIPTVVPPESTPVPTEGPSAPIVEETPTHPPGADYTPKLEARPCNTYNPSVNDREGETYACGVMIVPQDRQQPDGKQLEIKYAILSSLSGDPRPDPMLFLSGGPGNSALYPDGFVELAARLGPMRQTRDIILFDQRGVGMSVPALDCSSIPAIEDEGRRAELLAEYTARTGVEPDEENQSTVDCVLSLWDQGVELSHFTSAASAADTVDLMRALAGARGYEAYNLYGISYGTRLAETIMRDFPELDPVRTITFDSVFPRPVGEFDAAYYIGKHEMFEYVFEACAADPACDEAYPDLAARFAALVEALNAKPLKLPDDTELSGDDLYRSMYPFEDRGPGWIPLIPYLPKMIAELEQGQTETFMGLRNGTLVPSESPEIPDSVYDVMDKISNCTAIQQDEAKNDRYRQMYNARPERVAELVNELCTPEEAKPIVDQVQTMGTEDVNEVVKRLFYTSARSSSPWVRTQFNCNEAYPFGETPETVEAKMREAGMPQFLIDEALETVNKAAKSCKEWPSGVAPAFENEPVSREQRGLLLNGEFDYVTYPKWAEELHGRMPNSAYILVPNALHSLLSNYGECPTGITLQFLDDPSQPPDAACTAGMGIQWWLPGTAGSPSLAGSPTGVPLLTWEQLENATYLMPVEMGGPEDGQIRLEDGYFSYAPVPGSASVEQFLLYPGVAFGDLDGDGVEDAAVILINVSAGTGNFYHLVPVRNQGGQPQPLEAGYIGDRVVVEDVRVVDGEVDLLFKTYRPEEPYGSTPTLQVARRYALRGDALEQISEEVLNADEVINKTKVRQVVNVELPTEGGAASYTGQTGPFGLDEYALPLVAGQALTISVTSPNQDAFLSIFGLDLGGSLVRAQDERASWQGMVTQTQEYAVNVFAIGTETEYSLNIQASAQPTAPTPESTPTTRPAATEEGDKVVYLTFDDGPTPPYTREILDLLAQYEARATFFVLGSNGKKHADLLETAHQAGHTLANHTWSHRSLAGMSQTDFNQELQKTAEVLGAAAAPCMRPPYGATDSHTRAYAAELGYDVVMWNIDTLDWKRPGAKAVASTVMNKVYPGAIVLMHDGGGDRTQTVAALEAVLRDLGSEGYRLEALCR